MWGLCWWPARPALWNKLLWQDVDMYERHHGLSWLSILSLVLKSSALYLLILVPFPDDSIGICHQCTILVTFALLRPYIICLTQGSNAQPHYDNSHYQPLHSLTWVTPRPRPLHSLMAIRLMFTSCQILHHAYRTALHLGASCISSPLYDPYLASCSSHALLKTRTRPIGYDPLI